MNEHDCVASWEPIDNEQEYLYLIKRTRGLPDVRVHLTDAYEYSRAEYLARPAEVMKRNSFVVLGDPNAYAPSVALVTDARKDGVGIGFIRKFMGALTSRDVWEYEAPEERETDGLLCSVGETWWVPRAGARARLRRGSLPSAWAGPGRRRCCSSASTMS